MESTLGLAGEAGEFADVIKKQLRDGVVNVDRMIEELGDVLWYVASLSGQMGYSIEELATFNYQKLNRRHPTMYPDIVQ